MLRKTPGLCRNTFTVADIAVLAGFFLSIPVQSKFRKNTSCKGINRSVATKRNLPREGQQTMVRNVRSLFW